MSVRAVFPYRANVIASRIDDFPAPVRPVMTVYFSGNRSGGTVFSRYRMKPRISISSRTNPSGPEPRAHRSEEHTSELQSLAYIVCRLLLEKKKNNTGFVKMMN